MGGGSPATLGVWRFVGFLAKEPAHPADRSEDRGDRRLVQACMLSGPGYRRLGLPLAEPLRDLPHAPAENRVAPIDDPHGSPFRTERTKGVLYEPDARNPGWRCLCRRTCPRPHPGVMPPAGPGVFLV